MAVEFDAETDAYKATTGLPANGNALTVVLWISPTASRAAKSTPLAISNVSVDGGSGTTQNLLINTDTTGLNLRGESFSSTFGTARAMTVGNWYRVAVTISGTTGTLYTGDASLNALQAAGAAVFTASWIPAAIWIGRASWNGEWWNGRVAAVKLYDAVLTQAEIEAELTQFLPRRTANLLRFHPFVNPENIDYSGAGNNLTNGSTSTIVGDNPPIPWNSGQRNTVSGGPATQQASLSLIATPTLTETAQIISASSVLLTATPTLTASPSQVNVASLSLTITPTLTTTGIVLRPASVTLIASPSIAIAATLTVRPSLSLTVIPNIFINPGFTGNVNLTATPTITLNGRITFFAASITLTATPTFSSSLRLTAFASVLLTITPTATFTGSRSRSMLIATRYPRPPLQYPFRIIAQEVLTRQIVDWDLPVADDFTYTTQLSGPTVMQGSFKPEIISVQELGLDGYAYFFHVEIEGEIRATGLFLPPKYEESSLTFTCEGIAALPHYITWEGMLSAIGIDPLTVIRNIWNHVQSNPLSNLGVVVSNLLSGKKLGTPAHTELTTDSTGQPDTRDVDAEPYELLWWEAPNCGEEIDNLATQTPFDYKERVAWNTAKTDVTLNIDLGYPRLGAPKPNLLFNEDNIIEVVPVQEGEDTYASEVIVIGSGEGSATIRGYAASTFGKRIRKVHVVTDKTITTQARADQVAKSELDLRKGNLFTIDEIAVRAKHQNASIGEYDVGDDIYVQVEVPWLMETYGAWYRIISISYSPTSEIAKLTLNRSDSYRYPVVTT